MNFIAQNSEIINALTNVGILLVWLIYAQLLYLNFARQRKPKIMINQVQGYDLDSVCIISNMSQEPIHIECLLLVVQFSDHSITYNVTEEPRNGTNSSMKEISSMTRQGPLMPGKYILIGRFRTMLERLIRKDDKFPDGDNMNDFIDAVTGLEIRAIADYGPDKYPVGSLKRFGIERNERGDFIIYPESFYTRQVTGWRAKHYTIPKWFNACTNKYLA